MNLTAGSIVHEGDKVFYEYRGKGGKTGKRELPRPAYEAIRRGTRCLGKGPGDDERRRVTLAVG